MRAERMHRRGRLAKGTKGKANTLGEGPEQPQDRSSADAPSSHGVRRHMVVALIEVTCKGLVFNRHSTLAGRHSSAAHGAHVSTLVPRRAIMDRLQVEEEAMCAARVMPVRERHTMEAQVRDDPKAAGADTADGGGGECGGKERARLTVAADPTPRDVAIDDTQDRVVVVIPAPPREMGTRQLHTVWVTDAVLCGTIRD